MTMLLNLILEKFEVPTDLKKQLENTSYSALGHLLEPEVLEIKKSYFTNKGLNDITYNSLKNVFDTIRKFTESSGGNTTLTFSDVFVPQYFSIISSKLVTKKTKVTIEKTNDDIYVSDAGKHKVFPNMVISKDSAGWDLHKMNSIWKSFQTSYDQMKVEFDGAIVSIEQLEKTLNGWKLLDKPKKPKITPNGLKMSLVYEKSSPIGNFKYDHYFRVVSNRHSDDNPNPDFFSRPSSGSPYIVQTIYLDYFHIGHQEALKSQINKFIETSRHEGRHLVQYYGNIQHNLKGDHYGGPKRDIRHDKNPNVRGIDPAGTSSPDTKFKDPNDRWNRVLHPHRDVEFKSNLYDYKNDIETVLSLNKPRNQWKQGFKELLMYSVGKLSYVQFKNLFPKNHTWEYSMTKNNLRSLYTHDRPKFDQYIKELYKLIFP